MGKGLGRSRLIDVVIYLLINSRYCHDWSIAHQEQVRNDFSPKSRALSQTWSTLPPNQKSYTRIEGIQRTPSIQNINPYLERLEAKSTDKKPAYKVSYQAPVLMEQNKTLLA